MGNGPARSTEKVRPNTRGFIRPKTEPVLLSVNIKDLEQVFKQGNVFQVILNLVIQNGKKVTKAAMVKELQTHPVREILFILISMKLI